MSGHAAAGTWARALRDPVAVALLVAVLLGAAQQWALGAAGRPSAAAGPYLLALGVVVAVRAQGPRDEAGLGRWVRGLALAGALLALWLLAAFLLALPDGLGAPHGFYRVKVAVTSPVGDHNTAAGLLLPTVVAGSVAAARDRRWLPVLAVTAAGLVATLSRGAALVLLIVALVGLRWGHDRGAARRLVVAAVAAVALVAALSLTLDASPPPTARLERSDGPVGASVLGRVDLARRGVEVGLARPLTGVGLGGLGRHTTDLPPPNDHAHQLLAHAFAEGGVVLLGVAVAVPLALAVRLRRLPPGGGRDALLLGGLGLLAHAQVDVLGGLAGYEALLALLAGLAGAAAPGGDAPGGDGAGAAAT